MGHRFATSLLHLAITVGIGLLVVARASALAWPMPARADLGVAPTNYRARDSR